MALTDSWDYSLLEVSNYEQTGSYFFKLNLLCNPNKALHTF